MTTQASTSQTPDRTDCCIVGAGPAGAVLALLLARQGIGVTVLESHQHFDRAFRGDSLHPSALELFDDLGLADELLRLPHTRIERFTLSGPALGAPLLLADLRRLPSKFPYIMMLDQARFIAWVLDVAQRSGAVQVVMGARVDGLIEEGGAICGVRYGGEDSQRELRATLTVGADGRFSRTRRLAGLELSAIGAPIDVLWFRLPRRADDQQPLAATVRLGAGGVAVLFDRGTYWQVGYVIAKGSYQQFRRDGLDTFQRHFAALVPELADRVGGLDSWQQLTLLTIEAGRLRRWHRDGLLLIGDAAHVMSPLGGVGINCAIHDAAAAAALARPLAAGALRREDLALVQRRRERQTSITQTIQALLHHFLLPSRPTAGRAGWLRAAGWLRKFPLVSDTMARVVALGTPWPRAYRH